MILTFKKIILHNFASYAHAELELTSRGFCAVQGKNRYKKDNSASNGSGKSFIWSGICFALTGETIAGQHSGLKNILIDENSCYVTVEFTADSDSYTITRYVAPKTDLQIIRNGADVSGKGIRESEKKLGELLPDLTKDFIASTFIIGQGMPNAFSKFKPSGRKDILEKLTNSDYMIEAIKQRVSSRASQLDQELRQAEDALLVAQTKLESTQRNLATLENKLTSMQKPDFDAEIAKFTLQLADLSKTSISLQAEAEQYQADITAADTAYAELLNSKTQKLAKLNESYTSAIATSLTRKSDLVTTLSMKRADYSALNKEICQMKAIKDICPTCGQKLIGVVKPSTASKETQLQQIAAEITELQNKLSDLEADLASKANQKQGYATQVDTEFAQQLAASIQAKRSAQQNMSVVQSKQIAAQSNLKIISSTIEGLRAEQSTWDANYNSLLTEISTAKTEVDLLSKTCTDCKIQQQELLAHVAVVRRIDTLVKRDLRGYLLSNIIDYINAKAQDFAQIVFGTRDLHLTLNGNDLDITYADRMFDNLSGGERMRVDLILQLAIRDMLKKYLNTHANILVLDEITDFLDKQSCKAVMTLVEQELNTVESVFIISHHADELNLPIDSELNIIKNEDGISCIAV